MKTTANASHIQPRMNLVCFCCCLFVCLFGCFVCGILVCYVRRSHRLIRFHIVLVDVCFGSDLLSAIFLFCFFFSVCLFVWRVITALTLLHVTWMPLIFPFFPHSFITRLTQLKSAQWHTQTNGILIAKCCIATRDAQCLWCTLVMYADLPWTRALLAVRGERFACANSQ